MAFSDYSLTPSANTSIAGINIAENCPAANINNALRQIAADGKDLSVTVTGLTTGFTGGAVSVALTQTGAGAYRYNVDSTLTSGRDYHLIEGSARPTSPSEGDRVFYYT